MQVHLLHMLMQIHVFPCGTYSQFEKIHYSLKYNVCIHLLTIFFHVHVLTYLCILSKRKTYLVVKYYHLDLHY